MSPMAPMTERTENVGSVNVHQMMGPATPMTPMTPGSADPGILPQLQLVTQAFYPIQHLILYLALQKYCFDCES